jgi:hypothetical protein
MTGPRDDHDHVERTTEKPPERWVTGDEPMTGAQRSYLETLSREAGQEPPSDDLSKAEASERIDELQEATGRGGD